MLPPPWPTSETSDVRRHIGNINSATAVPDIHDKGYIDLDNMDRKANVLRYEAYDVLLGRHASPELFQEVRHFTEEDDSDCEKAPTQIMRLQWRLERGAVGNDEHDVERLPSPERCADGVVVDTLPHISKTNVPPVGDTITFLLASSYDPQGVLLPDEDGERAQVAENAINDFVKMDPNVMDSITFADFIQRLKQLEAIVDNGATNSVIMQARRAILAHWRMLRCGFCDFKNVEGTCICECCLAPLDYLTPRQRHATADSQELPRFYVSKISGQVSTS